MSWFTNLKNKAEDLLNEVDQTAAKSLSRQEGLKNSSGQNILSDAPEIRNAIPIINAAVKTTEVSVPISNIENGLAQKKENLTVNKPRSVAPLPNDEQLFNFLNSSVTIPTSKSSKKGQVISKDTTDYGDNGDENTSNSSKHSRASSSSSFTSAVSGLFGTREANATPVGVNDSLKNIAPSVTIEIDTKVKKERSRLQTSDTTEHSKRRSDQNKSVSYVEAKEMNMETENKMLKGTLESLTEELEENSKQIKLLQEELKQSNKKVDYWCSQVAVCEKNIRQFQSRESDSLEKLSAKESQIAVLRGSLQAAEEKATLTSAQLTEAQSKCARVLQDHTESSVIQTQALDNLKSKLYNAERALEARSNSANEVENEFSKKVSVVEEENRKFTKLVSEYQSEIAEGKNTVAQLQKQLQQAQDAAKLVEIEFENYKLKAQRILQSKDNVIENMKNDQEPTKLMEEYEKTEHDLEEAIQERDDLRAKVDSIRYSVEQLKAELQDADAHHQAEMESVQSQHQLLSDEMSSEKRQREACEQDVKKKEGELRYFQDQLYQQKLSHQSTVQELQNALTLTVKQLEEQKASDSTVAELENRIHSLTESLLQKQNLVETLSVEKSSLSLQLERMQQQYIAMQAATPSAPQALAVPDEDDDGLRTRAPTFMRESPFDTKVAQHVKKVYNSLDKFSVRFGRYLRQYPIVRALLLLYVILLHFWVIFILLTYTPEIHTGDMLRQESGMPKPPAPAARQVE